MIRRVLAACDPQVAGPAVTEVAAGRPFTQFRPYTPAEPYGEGEWARLQQTCRQGADQAMAAHRQAMAAAARGKDPETTAGVGRTYPGCWPAAGR
jgi:hypothetical protein